VQKEKGHDLMKKLGHNTQKLGRPDLWTMGLLKSNKRLLRLKEKAKKRGSNN
jgi:hypothetical protein